MHFSFVTFLLQVVNLLVVFYFLKLVLYKPLLKLMEDRQKQVDQQLDYAASTMRQAEEMMAQYQEQLAKAKADAQAIIDQATRLGNQMKEQTVAEARQEAEKLLARAREQIEKDKNQASQELRNQAANWALLIAQRVLGREVTDQDQDRLIDNVTGQLDRLH